MSEDEQKPYAYAYIREDGVGLLCWTKRDASLFKDLLEGRKEVPLYTHSHQWQGLTDDEIDKIYADTEPNSKMDTYYMVLSRAIEQALKEKNHETT